MASYEAAMGTQLPREPIWAAARDPLYGQPGRQHARAAALMQLWGGGPRAAWEDILHAEGRNLFVQGYRLYRSFQ